MKYISIILILFVAMSCTSLDKVLKYSAKHPEVKTLLCPDIDTTSRVITTVKIDTVIKFVEDDNSYLLQLIAESKDLDCQSKLDSVVKTCKPKIKYITINKNTTDTVIIHKTTSIPVNRDVVLKHWTYTAFWILLGCVVLFVAGLVVRGRVRK